MIKTIFNDGEIRIRLDTFLKHCVQCGQYAIYRISYPKRHYGWRLCGLHLDDIHRKIISDYYGI